MNELLQTKFKGAFASGLDAKEAFIQKYLPNLAKGTEPSAAVLADDNGKWGDARRDLFYEAMKPPMSDSFINPPAEGYSIKRSDRSVFRDYSLRNILSMTPSGGSTAFNANAYYKVKQNFMPAKVGDKDVFTNGVGTRVIEGTRGYRLYKPDGSLEGVYGDLETAMQKGHKVSASFQPDVEARSIESYEARKRASMETARPQIQYDPESRVEPPSFASAGADPTEVSRLAYFLSPEGIQARHERLSQMAAKKTAEFEAMLNRPMPSMDPERITKSSG
jgi:hypothetical protein